MDDNLGSAIDKLQSMLSSDSGKKDLENMIGSLGGLGGGTGSGMGSGLNMDAMMKMKDVMEQLQRRDDPRSQLLLALKPYLSRSRSSKLDTAIQFLSLGKLPTIMKNMRG